MARPFDLARPLFINFHVELVCFVVLDKLRNSLSNYLWKRLWSCKPSTWSRFLVICSLSRAFLFLLKYICEGGFVSLSLASHQTDCAFLAEHFD